MAHIRVLSAMVLVGGMNLGLPDPLAAQSSQATPSGGRENPRDILSARQWGLIDRSADRALAWLATQQRRDGSFMTLDTGQPGVTALCVLAFLARGNLPGEGQYGTTLTRAIGYTLDCQQPDGVFSRIPPTMPTEPINASYTSNYNHPIAGLMLSEVYGMTRGDLARRIRPAVEKAIRYAGQRLPQPKRRAVDEGGWRYRTYRLKDDADLSVTSWHLMFLRSSKNAGFEVPTHLIDEGLQYIGRLYKPEKETFIYGLDLKVITRAMAGAGILSFSLGGKHGDERAVQAGEFLLRRPFTRYNRGENYQEHYFYSCFYSSQAMFQLGGRYWKEFYPPMARTLTTHQRTDGSWDPDCHDYDQRFGQTYTTALAVLALSPASQLLPIFQR